MEDVFKNSKEMMENNFQIDEQVYKTNIFRNLFVGTSCILAYYIISSTLSFCGLDIFKEYFFLFMGGFFITFALATLYFSQRNNKKIEILYKYTIYLIFLFIHYYIVYKIGFRRPNYQIFFKFFYLKMFFCNFFLFSFIKLPNYMPLITLGIDGYIIICIPNHCSFDFLILVILFFCNIVVNLEAENNILTLLKYEHMNKKSMKYIDGLINKMFCLFFTFSENSIVFTNRSARDFLTSRFYNESKEKDPIIGKYLNFNF
jgi:hypothetical protein